jgi:GrpB-like predicted nucleotidyltransferase (UPF0157 family)
LPGTAVVTRASLPPALGLTAGVTIVDYDPRWPQLFEQARAELSEALGQSVIAVHHVGSTAVPGLCAKPVLDILVSVPYLQTALQLVPKLESLGYEFRPNEGIADRLFFRRRIGTARTHHLSLSEPASHHHVATLEFRDALRANADVASAYAQLKLRLAREFPQDRGAYIRSKTEFVLNVIRNAGVKD